MATKFNKDEQDKKNYSSLNNIVPLDNDWVWLVANNHIKSCRLLPGNQLSTTGTFRSSAILGCGTRQANDVYASCQAPYVIKYPFGTDHAERIAYRNTWYDAETQLTTLQDGSILLFMKICTWLFCRLLPGRLQTWK